MHADYITVLGLGLIMAVTLAAPLSVKRIEEELEGFLLVMGLCAVTISSLWSWKLVAEALRAPVEISAAVLAAGFLFNRLHAPLVKCVEWMDKKIGIKLTAFLIVTALGFGSSMITAVIAALALSELTAVLRMERKTEIRFAILGCFAIGLGAALTPLGEPLSTIVARKLQGPPHNADFYFLWNMLAPWLVPGILALALIAAALAERSAGGRSLARQAGDTPYGILMRAGKVYMFVAALTLLGAGLEPLAMITVTKFSPGQLYWINIASAALDNATLAAAEVTPALSRETITALLLGLLAAGGMLIPGNIPNIVCAARLDIKSAQWARFAVGLGLAIMLVYFILMEIFL